ncbi:MAG: hypothetical protein HFJ25_05650 [Clostridia bacterium]|nr:hypothetical protein [Clostridia bacterium]
MKAYNCRRCPFKIACFEEGYDAACVYEKELRKRFQRLKNSVKHSQKMLTAKFPKNWRTKIGKK